MILFDDLEITEGTLESIDSNQDTNPIQHILATAIVSAGQADMHKGEEGNRRLFVPVFLEGEAAADFRAIEDEHGYADALGAIENGLHLGGTAAE
jgi:hypothetical protein